MRSVGWAKSAPVDDGGHGAGADVPTLRGRETRRCPPYGALVTALLLSGCSGWQSALDPQGPQAQHLAFIIWLFTAVCAAIWAAVMLALCIALLRRRPQRA